MIQRLFLKNSIHHGDPSKDRHIRMTYIDKSSPVKDICIKTPNWLQNEHGISLCFKDQGWGEFTLVPEKHNYLIDDLYAAAHVDD